MFLDFLYLLRRQGLSVGIQEWLCLCEALQRGHVQESLLRFYYLARSIVCKTEADYDLYDQCFHHFFHDVIPSETVKDELAQWLAEAKPPRLLTDEEKRRLQEMNPDELKKLFEQRMQEQTERHDGGNRWIGTGGSSPFGHGGFHPSGLRVGGPGQHQQAMQIAARRKFQGLRKDVILDTRQMGLALRKLREWGRWGTREELDLEASIDATARNAGDIELVMRAPRRNETKLVLLMDIGGSMTYHSHLCEKLFAAATKINHFKEIRNFYFHNCPYEHLYADSELEQSLATEEILRQLDKSWFLIIVGDAAMSPYELTAVGGAIDYFHHNETPGIAWLQKLRERLPQAIWLNPEPKAYWQRASNQIIRQVFPEMYPLSVQGLEEAMQSLQTQSQRLSVSN